MKLIVELSGEHPEIPFAELEILGPVLERRRQVAVVDAHDPADASRLAMAHCVLEYIGACEARGEDFSGLLERLDISSDEPFASRVRKIFGNTMDLSSGELEKMMGSRIRGRVSLANPATEFRAVISEDRCYFGRVLMRAERDSFHQRRPGNRPFFHPGVMMPRIARALVNISLVGEGETMLDPFCGTGGIVLEARLMGVNAVGSDIDPDMVIGSRKNLPHGNLVLADSTDLPFRTGTIDAVVTDLPYGQSSAIWAKDLDHLYSETIQEINRVLAPGARAVLVTHRDIAALAGTHMQVRAMYQQRVHKSLTRRILVLEKKPGKCP
jgi:tRNA (guanine10-N2)-dimethyltransferase